MFRKLVFIIASFALLLSACGAPPPVPAELVFTDGLGRTVKLPKPAEKIISLAPSNTEILFAIGAGKQVIGRDDYSDYPAEAKSLPSLGGLDKYNNEQLVALKPDLILMAEINSPEQAKQLESLGLNVFYLANPKTLEEMYTNLSLIARMTGHEQDASALVDTLKTRVAAVDEKIKAANTKPVVFYELDSTDPAKPYTIGAGTFIDQLITRAGGQNLTTAAGVKDSYPQLSIEQIVSADPDFIILGDSMWGVTVESVGMRPGWEKLKAVAAKQVYPFDDNTASRPGPRLVDGLEALAKLLHPEVYK
ncbi:MAG TPA: cobalamin-binding protein [Anaerolineales bacterium]|jgi:iron complex transport system substrate-binding protein